jgi:hypothetical protein
MLIIHYIVHEIADRVKIALAAKGLDNVQIFNTVILSVGWGRGMLLPKKILIIKARPELFYH